MTAPPVDWSDKNDPVVQLGLTLKCGSCQAPPGQFCTNTVNGQPLTTLGRVIHHFRLDKGFADDKEAT